MKQHGKTKLLNAVDWPSFVETVRPIYEDFELAKLFKACTVAEQVRFKFYLMSGFRDAEGRFVTWRDVDFKHMAIRVTAKPHWGFQPKNWEEREVPVPQKLILLLQQFRHATASPDDPLFPSATGTKRWLHVASHSLLAEKVGNVVGAEGAGSMSLAHRGRHGLGAIFTNEEEQFADLPGQRAVGIGQATQVRFRGGTEPADQTLLSGRALRGR